MYTRIIVRNIVTLYHKHAQIEALLEELHMRKNMYQFNKALNPLKPDAFCRGGCTRLLVKFGVQTKSHTAKTELRRGGSLDVQVLYQVSL